MPTCHRLATTPYKATPHAIPLLALLLLTACAAKPEGELTCMMARMWQDEAKQCRADPACIGDKDRLFDAEIKEMDVKAANKHFACRVK